MGEVCVWRLCCCLSQWSISETCFTSSVFVSFLRNSNVYVCLSPFPSLFSWRYETKTSVSATSGKLEVPSSHTKPRDQHGTKWAVWPHLTSQTSRLWELTKIFATWIWLDDITEGRSLDRALSIASFSSPSSSGRCFSFCEVCAQALCHACEIGGGWLKQNYALLFCKGSIRVCPKGSLCSPLE